jgi:ribosomal 50S subunit-associated protein YjgA (DUF615 family)
MNINEELDKIIDKHKVDVSYVGRLESFKIEILELFERKLNEVVPEYPLSVCVSVAEVRIRRDVITDMQQNIKKVLEGV